MVGVLNPKFYYPLRPYIHRAWRRTNLWRFKGSLCLVTPICERVVIGCLGGGGAREGVAFGVGMVDCMGEGGWLEDGAEVDWKCLRWRWVELVGICGYGRYSVNWGMGRSSSLSGSMWCLVKILGRIKTNGLWLWWWRSGYELRVGKNGWWICFKEIVVRWRHLWNSFERKGMLIKGYVSRDYDFTRWKVKTPIPTMISWIAKKDT